MQNFKFSVAKVELKQGAVSKKEINLTTDISIEYDMSTVKKHGQDGLVQDEFSDTKQINISLTYAPEDIEPTLIKDEDYDLHFTTGANSGGIAVTLADCKLLKYSVIQSQSGFAMTTLIFSKKNEMNSVVGASITKQRVKFGSNYIGDSAYVNVNYVGNTQPIIVPTALGVLIQSTSDLGGGQLEVRVRGYVKKDTRLELEQYLINLYNTLSTGSGTLTVEYGATSYTITNCYWRSGSPDISNKNFTDFELSFIKSAY